MSKKKKDSKQRKFRIKLAATPLFVCLLVGLFFFLIGLSIVGLSTQTEKTAITKKIKQDLLHNLGVVKGKLSARIHGAMDSSTGPDSTLYQRGLIELKQALESNPRIDSLYTLAWRDKGFVQLLDSDLIEPTAYYSEYHVPEPFKAKVIMDKLLAEGTYLFLRPLSDEYGVHFTALATLKELSGDAYGFIGIDYKLEEYFAQIKDAEQRASQLIGLVALFTFILMTLVYLFVRAVYKHFESRDLQYQEMKELTRMMPGILFKAEYTISTGEFKMTHIEKHPKSRIKIPAQELLEDWSTLDISSESYQTIKDSLAATIKEPHRWDCEFTYAPSSENQSFIQVDALGEVDEDKIRFSGIMLDESATRQLILELKENNHRFEELFRESTQLNFYISFDKQWVHIPNSESFTGFTPDLLENTNLSEWINPDDWEAVVENLDDSKRSGKASPAIQARLKHRFDGWVWVDWTVTLVKNAQGEALYWGGIATNIEPKIKAQDAQEQAQQELKSKVEELEKLTKQQDIYLQEKENLIKEGQAASEAKTNFLAVMSHELRTPLNSISGSIDLLLDDDGTNREELLNTLKGSSGSMLTLINDILDFSKISANKLELNREAFDLLEITETIDSVFKNLSEQKGLSFQSNVLPSTPQFLLGDAQKIRQILINLVNNAIKFTESGSVTINIKAADENFENKEFSPVQLLLEVIDTGVGIPQEKQSSIFDPFEQVDASDSRSYEGTGLGLAISHKLATTMEGSIQLTSEVNSGSTFSVFLPLEIARVSEIPEKEEDIIISDHKDMGQLSPLEILIVDDNRSNIRIIELFLEKLGYSTEKAYSGLQALAILEERSFDLIFLDIQMPGMSGFELAEKIREVHATSDTTPPHLIALTALTQEEDRQKCIASGINDYISKPIQLEGLIKIIQTITTKKETTHEVQST